MPGPKLFGVEDAGDEETEPPTGRVVHETARVLAATGGGVARRGPFATAIHLDNRVLQDLP